MSKSEALVYYFSNSFRSILSKSKEPAPVNSVAAECIENNSFPFETNGDPKISISLKVALQIKGL
jgi:hypothetical protein